MWSARQAHRSWQASLARRTPPGSPEAGSWIHPKPDCGQSCANSRRSRARANFGVSGGTERGGPCHPLAPSHPVSVLTPRLLLRSVPLHVPPQTPSLLQRPQVRGWFGINHQRDSFCSHRIYSTSFCWWGMGLRSYSGSEKCLSAEHGGTPSLLWCCRLRAPAPRKGKCGEKKCSDDCLKLLWRKGALWCCRRKEGKSARERRRRPVSNIQVQNLLDTSPGVKMWFSSLHSKS